MEIFRIFSSKESASPTRFEWCTWFVLNLLKPKLFEFFNSLLHIYMKSANNFGSRGWNSTAWSTVQSSSHQPVIDLSHRVIDLSHRVIDLSHRVIDWVIGHRTVIRQSHRSSTGHPPVIDWVIGHRTVIDLDALTANPVLLNQLFFLNSPFGFQI